MNKRLLLSSFFLFLPFNNFFAQQSIPEDALITLERNKGFFGFLHPCPYYKLSISSDGTLVLEPKSYDKENKMVAGEIIKGRISPEQMKKLIAEFERVDFYSLKSIFENQVNSTGDCTEFWTDASTVITSITFQGRSKKVQHYQGCRGNDSLLKLTNLENKIDEIVNTKQLFECYFKSI
jgi:hypothetical protein